jgi:oligopeptide/dipeptide ABC transporter ATP-binding protein
MKPVLELQGVEKYYSLQRGFFRKPLRLRAVHGISFSLSPGETLSIVGESGCGKSTLGKLILRIEEVSGGKIFFQQEEISSWNSHQLKRYWKKIQMVFQNPYASLNPRWTIRKIIAEPLQLQSDFSKQAIQERVESLVNQVGLLPEHLERYPHQFSGGQRQRIGIARALALQPEVLVCDEPVSALDVSIQSQVLNVLMDLQEQYPSLSYLFISHDLSVVEHLSDRILVMYLGKIVEYGSRSQIFSNPRHPYTQALLSAVPRIGAPSSRILLQGDLPSPLHPPSGCTFRTRCPFVQEECKEISMDLQEKETGHASACPFH